MKPNIELSQKEENKDSDNSLLPLLKEIKNLQQFYILPSKKTTNLAFQSIYIIDAPKALYTSNYKANKGRVHLSFIFHPPAC